MNKCLKKKTHFSMESNLCQLWGSRYIPHLIHVWYIHLCKRSCQVCTRWCRLVEKSVSPYALKMCFPSSRHNTPTSFLTSVRGAIQPWFHFKRDSFERGPPQGPCYMGKSTLQIDRYCPLVMQGFSNFLGFFQVIMANTVEKKSWWRFF